MKKIIFFYFLFLFFFLSFFASGVIDSQDGFQYLAIARGIYYKGQPIIDPYGYDEGNNIHMTSYTGKNGKTYSMTSLGLTLAYLPSVAIADIVYKILKVAPPLYFPLQSDWLILMLASFTNCFFAAILGVILFLYLLEFGLNKKQSLFISTITFLITNLFALSKHTFAHMMFATFLTLSFFCLKKYSRTKNKLFVLAAGAAYGAVIISYNQTFIFPVISLVIYYFLLVGVSFNVKSIKKYITDCLLAIIAIVPFYTVYFIFERWHGLGLESPAFIVKYAKGNFINYPYAVFLEGLYGQLFGPGRSIFLYSPILLLIFLFWHKLKKVIIPELIALFFMAIIYIGFYASMYSIGPGDGSIDGYWHGELSWGPRYLSPLIPLGMLIVGYIFKKMSKKAKLFVFLPLAVIGLYVEIIGVVMPYQIKLHDLDYGFWVNQTHYTLTTYPNLLPRYSPIFLMSKNLIKLIRNVPKTLDHGQYNVRFYDGIDFPFNIGGADRWRSIEGKGYISFDNNNKDPIKKFTLRLVNHPLNEIASSSASINFVLNNQKILEKDAVIKLNERKEIILPIKNNLLKPKNNQFIINVSFGDDNVLKKKIQLLGLITFFINDKEVNKESIDVPYVSNLGPALAGIKYINWGGTNKDLWRPWHIHTQIFERVPDFWWAKAIYYWDFPKKLFLVLFLINLAGIIYFGYKVYECIQIQQSKPRKH